MTFRFKLQVGQFMPRRFFLAALILIAIQALSILAFRNGDLQAIEKLLESAKKSSEGFSSQIEQEILRIEKLPVKAPALTQVIGEIDSSIAKLGAPRSQPIPNDFAKLEDDLRALRASLLAAASEREADRQHVLASLAAARREAITTTADFQSKLDEPQGAKDILVLGIKEFLSYLSLPLLLILALIVLSIFPLSPERIARALESFSSIKLGGAEVVLTQQLRRNSTEVVGSFREKVIQDFTSLSKKYDVADLLRRVVASPSVADVMGSSHVESIPGFRATIHIEDMLFSHTLYQLLDYYPNANDGRPSSHGAIKSIRFGIIGRSWRMERSDKSNVDGNALQLMADWGMTRQESRKATAIEGPKTVSATLLLHPQSRKPIAVLYMDATNANAFGDSDRFHVVIQEACKSCGLTKALAAIVEEARLAAPLIPIN